jgi:Iron-containing redox enzyme
MQPLDSLVVSENLESYARDRLAESDFFAGLSSGQINPGHVRDVFGQYHLWRSRFYRWFGICLVKSVPSGDALDAPRVLGELITCLEREIKGDHHRQALSFLAALGIDNPARIRALPVTDAYAESFLQCYFPADRTGDEALAALAGQELIAPGRDEIITSALPRHYGITSGLEFFSLHAEFNAEHFRALWETLANGTRADIRTLIEAARLEIWEHITFWDDVYSIILGVRHERTVIHDAALVIPALPNRQMKTG